MASGLAEWALSVFSLMFSSWSVCRYFCLSVHSLLFSMSLFIEKGVNKSSSSQLGLNLSRESLT